jgi:hypothetical protein
MLCGALVRKLYQHNNKIMLTGTTITEDFLYKFVRWIQTAKDKVRRQPYQIFWITNKL